MSRTPDDSVFRDFVLTVIINAIAIALTAWLLPGIEVIDNDLGSYVLIGFVFGVINALVKPLVSCLTCLLILATFGLFLLAINGLMLWLTAELLPSRLVVENFWWAIAGGLIMAIVGAFLESQFGLSKNKKDNR